MQLPRGWVLEGMRLRRGAFLELPIDWDVTLHAGSVDVHIRLEIDLQAEHDPMAGPRHGHTRSRSQAKVVGLGGAAGRVRQGSKLPHQDVGSGYAFAKVLFEILGDNRPLGIHHERTGVRNAKLRRARLHRLVQNAEGADDLRFRIGEQWKGDMLPVGEVLQYLYRVITDSRQPEALLPYLIEVLFQLHELDLAERSPVRGTVEHQHGALGAHDGLQCLGPARLVQRREIRRRATRGWPGLDVLPAKDHNSGQRKPRDSTHIAPGYLDESRADAASLHQC